MKLLTTLKRIISEIMVSKIDDWRENLSEPAPRVFTTLIAKDDNLDEKLYLFVGFTEINKLSHYSYSFMLISSDGMDRTKFLTTRNEITKYIPVDILGKKLIINIIFEMTRILLNNHLPDKIYRETVESLSGDSLVRYQKITDIMVSEYNYKLIEENVDSSGIRSWILKKKGINELNEKMEDEYELQQKYSKQEIATIAFTEAADVICSKLRTEYLKNNPSA